MIKWFKNRSLGVKAALIFNVLLFIMLLWFCWEVAITIYCFCALVASFLTILNSIADDEFFD